MDQTPGSTIIAHFATLTDPRIDHTKHHQLLDILTIALCVIISGADEWVAMEEYGKAQREWFDTFLTLPYGIPSHDTFGRLFAALDPDQFQHCFLAWVQQTVVQTEGAVIACEGCIVTIDAMGCQTAIAQTIIDREADYVLALKEKQEALDHEVVHLIADARATDFADYDADAAETVDGGHGRVEIHRYGTIRDPATLAHLDPDEAWAGLHAIGMVAAARRVKGKVTPETRYYLTSLTDAATFGRAVRGHWGIENGLRWVRDIAFREDESRARQGASAANLVVLRHIAVNLLKQERTATVGIKNKRLKAA